MLLPLALATAASAAAAAPIATTKEIAPGVLI
jgi:hypothetical protein